MKLGEIKLEALMMIFPGEVLLVSPDNIERALLNLESDTNFADYLAAMPGAINRCLGIFENYKLVPEKRADLMMSQGERVGAYCRFDLREIVRDCASIGKVNYVSKTLEGGAVAPNSDYKEMVDYRRESEGVILLPWQDDGKYILIYTPRLERVNNLSSENTDVLAEREDVASLIPYFVKSELLYTEHPEEAKVARSLFEQGLNGLLLNNESYQSKVESVYHM